MIKSFLLLLILLLSIITQVSSQGSAHISSGTYKLVNQKSKKVLGVAGSSLQDGAKVNQYQPTGAISQRWYLYYEGYLFGGRTYSIICSNSGKAIDNPSSSKVAGTQMQQYTWNEGENQMFVMTKLEDESVYFKNVASQLYLDIKDASKNHGAPLIQSTFHGGSSQRFYLIPHNL